MGGLKSKNWFILIEIIVGFIVVTAITVLGFIDSHMLRIRIVYLSASLLVVTVVFLYGMGWNSRYIPPPGVSSLQPESEEADKHKEELRKEVS